MTAARHLVRFLEGGATLHAGYAPESQNGPRLGLDLHILFLVRGANHALMSARQPVVRPQ
jgi:hypothetical protein